ncbi:PD-(D/E)XK nuclease superfamily protein [archaeon BMS3Abin17]|nr:PD-(D/E)XK nuclease superfamily protein [archaeon BMS3Abin17]HDZ61269.1 PD-(D/E)XK nuclease family protein [Candidatus Pacearchaeota archaeon]
MATYSHSRVTTFENCPYQYKLRYIDKKKPETPTTIEAFMGDMVHQALEDLYKRKKFRQRVAKESLVKFYRDLWKKNYSYDILIVKKGLDAENYRKMGEKFLTDYYDRMKPFEDMTILGLETQDRMTLKDGNQWHVRIDKLGCDSKGNYYVCDYKTNSRMKDQNEADEDRQLAMYSIWVKDKFKDAKSVKLIWHMLAFNKDAVSERTDKQVEKLQDEVIERIREIESATEFPTNVTALCDYCGFRGECPSFKHQAELEKIEVVEQFKEDEGVKLVDKYSEIKTKLSELKTAEEEFKDNLIRYAKQFEIDVAYGSNKKASVREFDRIVMPEGEDKAKFLQLLKDKGVYEECSMLCYPKLNSKVLKDEIEQEIKDKVNIEKDYRISLSRRKDLEEE